MGRSRLSQAITLVLLLLLGATLIAPIVAVVRGAFEDRGAFTFGWFQDIGEDVRTEAYRELVAVSSLVTRQSTDDIRATFEKWAGRSIDYYGGVVGKGLLSSLWLACATTLLCLLISMPLALLAENCRFAGRRVWLALIQVPMILPPFVGAIGLKGLLSRNGGINALLAHLGWIDPASPIDWLVSPFWSCVILEALYLYPIMFLNVQAALANIDPALDEAARNLGSGAWRRFWRITLPLMRPGLFAGSTLVFIWAFTELGTPLMVGLTDVTAVQVFRKVETTQPEGDAYALVVVLLLVSVVIYMLGKALLGRPAGAMMAKAASAAQPRRLAPLASLLATLPFAVIFILAVLPHIGVLLLSFSRSGAVEIAPSQLTGEFHSQLWQDVLHWNEPGRGVAGLSIVNSVKYSMIATAVDLVLGFAIAYLVVRRRSLATGLLDSLAMLPLAVPGLVMAFGYFVLTQGDSPVAFLNPQKHDPTMLLVIAYSVRRLPFIVRSCAAGLEQTSEALEEAAANLGASAARIMLRITVPLLAANFIAGGLLVFSRSMLEVSDSLVLAVDQNTYPMTKAIWDIADNPHSGVQLASALGVWGMVLLVGAIGGASAALGKRLGALFR